MRSSQILAEAFQEKPYWWEAAPPEEDETPLPESVDVAIVGAGYCGLCCAIELAAAGVRVAVLEAGVLGAGASTRNGGMVTGGQKFVVSGATAGLDPERQARILEDARYSLTQLEARIDRYALDADYDRCGRLILASVPAHYRRLESWAVLLRERTGVGASLVPRHELAAEIGGSRFFGGLLIEEYGGLHPAKYHRALRGAARARGVSLHSDTAVTAIRRTQSGFDVQSKRGGLSAREVFVATNGYTGNLVPYLRRRVVPVSSYLIATEILPDGLAERLSPRRRMFSDTKRDLWYFRLSPDGRRVVFGGRPGIFESDLRTAALRLHRAAAEVWPELSEIRVDFCWTGNIAVSADKLPHLGVIEGVHYAVCCNGSGVAMMSYLGEEVARKILGRRNRPSAFETASFQPPPLYRGWPWFVPLMAGWYRLRDALE